MNGDGTFKISSTAGSFSKASRYSGFVLTKRNCENEPSPASYRAEDAQHRLKAKACPTKLYKPTIGKEGIYECVG
jgi:hypothetical protein